MTDTVVIADQGTPDSGYRFSWGLAFAGGIAATAVTFFLLMLGSGFGLLLIHPMTQGAAAVPSFLTGGAIYFFVAQAFGFAIGGHLAGRLLGPELESRTQEDFRAGAHGLIAWAVAVLATLAVVGFAGLAAGVGGAATASLYGAHGAKSDTSGPAAYLVDKLFRPADGSGSTSGGDADNKARAEAGRLLETGFTRGEELAPDDRARLVALTSARAAMPRDAAAQRVDALQKDVQEKTRRAADIVRKAASYASLWIAFSLLFGAIVCVVSAIFARIEDDGEARR
ncbi:MAG TPA: hypothetical protein VNX86_01830 [Rhizomicrobium sp.]|nr:hypothetical protein [Rhizomicrobium sp.]